MIKWSKIELVQALTSTFMHGFQNNLAQCFSLKSRSAIWNICSQTLPTPPPPPCHPPLPPNFFYFLQMWILCLKTLTPPHAPFFFRFGFFANLSKKFTYPSPWNHPRPDFFSDLDSLPICQKIHLPAPVIKACGADKPWHNWNSFLNEQCAQMCSSWIAFRISSLKRRHFSVCFDIRNCTTDLMQQWLKKGLSQKFIQDWIRSTYRRIVFLYHPCRNSQTLTRNISYCQSKFYTDEDGIPRFDRLYAR